MDCKHLCCLKMKHFPIIVLGIVVMVGLSFTIIEGNTYTLVSNFNVFSGLHRHVG